MKFYLFSIAQLTTLAGLLLGGTILHAQDLQRDANSKPAAHRGAGAADSSSVELIGVAELSGSQRDLSGLADSIGEGIPHDLLGGISAIDRIGQTDEYLALSDRGPNDGAVPYQDRVHRLRISIEPNATEPVRVELLATILLRDIKGRPFVGLASAFDATEDCAGRLDPEAIRVTKDGTFFVSDEYGPRILQFAADGEQRAEVATPDGFHVTHAAADEDEEIAANSRGRLTNKGMEGLALFGDQALAGLMQYPLIQDSKKNAKGKFKGRNCRLFTVNTDGSDPHQYVYSLDDTGYKLSEILAVDNHRFLAIERDGEAGQAAKFKRITEIDIAGATDIAQLESLPAGDLPQSIRPVKKSTAIDLLDPRFGLNNETMPEKFEGLCWAKDLPDGRRTLLITVDNDFQTNMPTRVYAFALPARKLSNSK